MAVKTNITINIVEPGSDVPVPDTGLFTHGIGGTETTIIVSAVLVTVLVILSIVLTTYMYRKHKKQGRTTKLVHIIDQTKAVVKSKKGVTIGLSIIALLVSACTFTAFMLNTNKSNTNAIEGNDTEQQTENTNNLTINAESKELTIEVKDQPVFAVLPVQVTVEEATQAGYTLTAYTDNTDLVSTTNPNNKIPMVTVEGDELTSLEDNTWGLALDNEPEAKDNKVYKALSTDQDNPTIIKTIDDYSETPANDTTTIYYGFYITPDTPYGTYIGSDTYYNATTNSSTVIFNGNGLYFNNNPEQTTNNIEYITGITSNTTKYSHTPNINEEGEASGTLGYLGREFNQVITIPGASKVRVKFSYGGGYIYSGGGGGYSGGFLSFWQGAHPDYTTSNNEDSTVKTCGTSDVTNGKFYGDRNDENVIITTECELDGDAATFAYWVTGGGPGSTGPIYGYYATVTGYDADGNIIYLPGNTQVGGEYQEPAQDLPYIFLGWSEDKDATTATYESKNDIELNLPLTNGKATKLYAIWQHATMITFNSNNDNNGEILNKVLMSNEDINLCSYYYFNIDGYIFNNWNTEPDNSGTTYDNCYRYTAPTDQSVKLNLYAQWVPATTIKYDSNGGRGGEGTSIAAGHTRAISNGGSFSRYGYILSHWNTKPDGSGFTYNKGEQFTAPSQPQVIILYAQWERILVIEDLIYMQDFNTLSETDKTSVLNSMVVGQQYQLKDGRDKKNYFISKLKDGNVWMTQNLDFDIVNGGASLDSTNTDVPAGWADAGNLTDTYNDTTWNYSNITPESYNPGDLYWNGELNVDYNGVLDALTNNSGDPHYHIGNYYNWTAAVAMSNSEKYGTSSSGSVDQSICPAGWKLPTGLWASSGSFQDLINKQRQLAAGTDGNIQNNPVYFVYGGSWYGVFSEFGSSGSYWSNSFEFKSSYSYKTYKLFFRVDGLLNPKYISSDRWVGNSLRCVVR